jgi:hypothetical protein
VARLKATKEVVLHKATKAVPLKAIKAAPLKAIKVVHRKVTKAVHRKVTKAVRRTVIKAVRRKVISLVQTQQSPTRSREDISINKARSLSMLEEINSKGRHIIPAGHLQQHNTRIRGCSSHSVESLF